ncbi:hypothetical protein H5410_004578 [Solanum commersonii]|uniref:CBS domain-containing protein n=1 Tax=Solanum commersonii TaxID=4109 RepID=A0A9J6B7R7_SOLCO|nr:hypothetical protein H5410_004578 [Solanum commersonii]
MVLDFPIGPMATFQNSGNLLSLAKQPTASSIIQLPNLSLKLDKNNYFLWKENTLDILKDFSLDSFVLGSNSPTKTITVTPTSITTATKSSTTQAQPEITSNPAYEERQHNDLLILVWLRQIIYDPLFGHLTRASSSYDAWTEIEWIFQSQTYDDFISFILNELDSSFGIFKAALNMSSGTITPEELFGLLFQEEERLAEELHSTTINTQLGATPSHALQTLSRSIPKQAHLASPSAIVDPAAWYFDSGATHHVTSDMAILSLQTYTGNDGLAVGNGMKIPISHTSSSILSTHTQPIHLNNILHAPQISKNLLSVAKLIRDNNVYMVFHPYVCYVKDLQDRKLLRGTLNDDLYRHQPPSPHYRSSPPLVFLGERTSLVGWHCRLAHPMKLYFGGLYSSHHKGYLYYHVASSRIYITRHVVFDENTFPYFSMLPIPKSSCPSSHSSNTSLSLLDQASQQVRSHSPTHSIAPRSLLNIPIVSSIPSFEQLNHTNAPSTVPPPAPPQIEHVPSTDPPEHLPPSIDSSYPTTTPSYFCPSNTSRHHMVVRTLIEDQSLVVRYVSSQNQIAVIFTKVVGTSRFLNLRSKLMGSRERKGICSCAPLRELKKTGRRASVSGWYSNILSSVTDDFSQFMTVTVEPNDTILDAAKKMFESQTSSAIVVVDKKPQGILTKELRHKFFGRFRRRHSRSMSQSPLRHRSYEDRSHKSHSRKYDEMDHYYETRSRMDRNTIPDHRRGRSRSPGGRRGRIQVRDDSEERRARIEQWNREKEQEELDNMDNADINYKNESNENEFSPNKPPLQRPMKKKLVRQEWKCKLEGWANWLYSLEKNI